MKIIGNNTYQNIQTSVTKFKSVQRGLLHADKRKISIIFWRSSLHNTNLSYLTSYPPNKISAKYVSEHLDKRKTILIQIPLKSQKQDFKTTIKYYKPTCKSLYIWINSNSFFGPSIIKEHKFASTCTIQ